MVPLQAYLKMLYTEIPGLENVERDVIEKYVKALVALPPDNQPKARRQSTKPTTLKIKKEEVSANMFVLERFRSLTLTNPAKLI